MRTRDPGPMAQDTGPGPGARDLGPEIQNPRRGTRGPGPRTLDPRLQDLQPWI